MRTARSAVPVFVLTAAMSLPAAGCGIGTRPVDRAAPPGPATSTPAQASPTEKLADAAAKTNQGVITVVMRAPGVVTDTRLDPAARKGTMSISIEGPGEEVVRADLIQIDTDVYLRMPDLPGAGKKWMHSRVSDLPAGSPLHLFRGADHSGAADLAGCVVSATRKGGHDYVGMMDLTRSRTLNRGVLDELGPLARAVPFSARTSRGGDLHEISIDVPSVLPEHGRITYGYSRSDGGVDAERPAPADVTELPGSLADRLEV
ncbi:hypothetical protein O7626_02125 [Micromonospora sp. WMMD1102]|uniref:hypothetical protein n=1 Tax=Micromonospora sp. WMMD1102 TaxID=3016105 RepID=UPI0024155D66|nr:hypothetical protein [Micromonospora sp. WMMD1102]MDG4784739.1 hypothetical protein [Micromonospora sp. WMMD1102]